MLRTQPFSKSIISRAALGLLLSSAGASAFAQDASGSDTAAATDKPSALETVVVTAEKRTQSDVQTPVAVNAFDAEQLKELGAVRPTDLLRMVPNASYKSFFGESQNPTFCFRGICLTVPYGDGIEPPVAMYTDEVYSSSAFGQALAFFDVDRVEVLKGPQGTLYGRNATGGLVNVITKKPTDTFESGLSLEYGTYNNQVIDGYVSGPLSQSVRGRLAIQTHRRDGYVKGAIDGVDANDIDTQAYRGTLDIDLASDLTLELAANYFKVDQGAEAYALNGTKNAKTGETCGLNELMSGNCVGIFDDDTRSANSLYGKFDSKHWYGADIPGGLKPTNDIESFGGRATLTWDLGNWQLTSISGFTGGNKEIIEDLDGDIQYQYDDRLTADAKTYTQEFRANGSLRDMDWILGAFIYDDTRHLTTNLTPATYYADASKKDTDSYAVYGNIDIPLPMPNFKVVLGSRYSWEDMHINFSRSGEYTDEATDEKRSTSNGSFDGRAVLQWSPDKDMMAYASVSTGHHSGNINTQSQYGVIDKSSPLDALKPVKPEHLISYETGLKTYLLDNRLRLNATAFYYDFKDMQTSIYKYYTTSGGEVQGAGVLSNLDKVNVWGGEFEAQALLTRHLQMNLGYAVSDSKVHTDEVDKDENPLDGKELPFSNPSAFGGLSYNAYLGSYGSMTARIDYSWMAKHYFSLSNNVTEEGKAYGLTSANISWFSPNETYQVDVFGQNLTDENYFVYVQSLYTNTQQAVFGMPRTVGLRFTWKYQ